MPGPNDPSIRQMIQGVMNLPKEQPAELQEPMQPEAATDPGIPAAAPKKPRRGLSNPYIAAEAQRMFNPQMPPVPAQQPSNKALAQGTASVLDVEGRWGQPQRTENAR